MKILFLSRWYPYPPNNGSKARIYNLLKQLAAQHEITLLSFFDTADGSPQPLPAQLCRQVWTAPWHPYQPSEPRAILRLFSPKPRSQVATYSRAMADRVAAALSSESFDAAICSQLGTAEYVARCGGVPAILEELEIAAILSSGSRHVPVLQRARLQLTRIKLRAYLSRLLPRFGACTVVSEAERALVRSMVPDYTHLHLLPNVVDTEALVPDGTIALPNTLVYSGALTFGANFDAMRFFLSECYPLIKLEVPSVRLAITGHTEGVAVEKLSLDNTTTLTGYVPDIKPLIRQSWVCVVPLRVGGGTRIKILEAMALGTPVVATAKGVEGLDVIDGTHILVASTPKEFASRTVQLLRQPELRARLAAQARDLVVQRYGLNSIRAPLDTILRIALAERGALNARMKVVAYGPKPQHPGS